MLFISAIPFNMAYAYDLIQLIECNRSDSVYHPKLDLRNLLEPAIMLWAKLRGEAKRRRMEAL